MTSHPYHQLLWLGCAAKRCCSIRTVRPTGGDIWRIATSLQVPPESFLRAIPAESVAAGFVLAPNGSPQQLALARRATKTRQATCTFLLQIGEDTARCGLGELRPLSCQVFPATATNGMLHVDEAHGCICRAWSIADLDRIAATSLLQREATERALDTQLIAEWNQQVAATNATHTMADFCAFLFHAYGHHTGRGIT